MRKCVSLDTEILYTLEHIYYVYDPCQLPETFPVFLLFFFILLLPYFALYYDKTASAREIQVRNKTDMLARQT